RGHGRRRRRHPTRPRLPAARARADDRRRSGGRGERVVSTPTTSRGLAAFFAGFLVVALLVAGGLSYFASADPDGLDTVALQGCESVETAAGEELKGGCIAQ